MEIPHGKYQFDDPLTPEEFARLEADILERGVQVAIEFDEDGNVLCGNNRLAICEKHGITNYPSVIRRGLSEEEKRRHARRDNLMRRQLTRDQVNRQIQAELRDNPTQSNRAIAKTYGVHHSTVGAVRRELESGGEISHVTETVGRDGKLYARSVRESGGEFSHLPKNLRRTFEAAEGFQSLENQLTAFLRHAIQIGSAVPTLKDREQRLRRLVSQLQEVLTAAKPTAVHDECNGDGCADCNGIGYLTGG